MNKASLVELRRQLDAALNSETPEAYAGLAPGLAEALRQLDPTPPRSAPPADALEPALQALEDAWLKGQAPTAPLPGRPEQQARLARLLTDMLAVQDFTLSLAKGDLVTDAEIQRRHGRRPQVFAGQPAPCHLADPDDRQGRLQSAD